MTIFNQYTLQPRISGLSAKENNNHHELLYLLLQLPIWFCMPLAGVEALVSKTTAEQNWGSTDLIHGQITTMLSKVYIPTAYIPQCMLWLVQFLRETEESSCLPSSTMSLLPQIPRYGWLLYWVVVLALSIPFAPEPNNDKQNSHSVVLARKWFHGIAILLFGPVTIAAPQLMSLSYAIALAVLMLLESARGTFPIIEQFHQRYLDPSKDSPDALVISHMALILGCALPLWILEVLLSSDNDDDHHGKMTSLPADTILLLQLWGILSLGIGDSMGAIVGVLKGRTRWSQHNSRTIEGSLAMWISLMVSCAWVHWFCGVQRSNTVSFLGQSTVTVTVVTLLEAHTSQIDNLVLPLVGAAVLLIILQPH
eukprot:Sro408_g136960.2  (367) ;mRNA; r:34497-35597